MKPMLAATFKPDVHSADDLVFPLIGSPKLDGVRAIVMDGELVSRRLLKIPNTFTQQALGNARFNGLDGELCCGLSYAADVFRNTTSAVMSEGGEPPITFWVFDNWEMTKEAYATRLNSLPNPIDIAESTNGEGHVRIRKLKNVVLQNYEMLLAYEVECLAKGYEGVMLRHPQGPYKFGRSTMREGWLIKVKRFEDSEAIVIGIVEQMHNGNEAQKNNLGLMKRTSHKANKVGKGTTGTLQVQDTKTGVMFEIGTGMDDAMRRAFWDKPPIGEVVKYKFQPTGGKDKPRFPVFIGMRKD